MKNPMDDFNLLATLDSPLLDQLAPELIPLRAEVVELSKRTRSECGACQQRKTLAALTVLQTKLLDQINKTPELQAIIPQLRATIPVRA